MKTLRQLSVAIVALALILVGPLADAQVLQNVPSDAMVVLKVKNLKDVSDKVAALSQQWGLANMRPELNDPLGTILTMANLGQGLDKAGEAGLALMDAGGNKEPNVLILIPVTDFKGFAASLPNSKAEGEFTTFSMGGNPQPGYVTNWGKYAAVSPQKEMLAKKGGGIALKGASAKEVESKDIVVYANIASIRAKVLPLLQQNKQGMLDQIGQAMAMQPGQNPKLAPAMKAYIGQFVNGAERFLTDTDALTFGVNLGKDGIALTTLADFQPGSYLGQLAAASKNTDASFTAGLPDGRYFVYGGFASDPKTGGQVLTDFLAPIEKELQGLGDEGKPLLAYLAATKEYFGAATQANFGWPAPQAQAIQQTGLVQIISIIKGDLPKLQAAQKKLFDAAPGMMKATNGEMAKATITPAAKTVDGVTLDQMKTTFQADPNNPMGAQIAAIMQMLYGANGMTAYSGVVGDKMIGIAGGPETLVAQAIAAAKSNADPLAQGPGAKLNANLPKSRLAAVYVPVDVIATTVFDVMAMQGMKAGVKLPPNLPPLAGTVATESTALRLDGYVPAQTVQSLIAAGMQMWLQGMQGGGAGQPGGL